MDYVNDIFISYAASSGVENQTMADWTLKFCDYLSLVMHRLYDTKPTILLHDDLRTRLELMQENKSQVFSNTAIFVIILSPEYIKSDTYMQELDEIYNSVCSGADESNNRPRIFKVLTMPIASVDQPKSLQQELSYNFFEINRFNKKPITYKFESQKGAEEKFWFKLVDLAYDISNALADLKEGFSDTDDQINHPGIFLAETSFDQVENRDMLKRELQHLGYRILPLIQLPDDNDQVKAVIDKGLRQAIMSIHLMGGWYGEYVKNSKYSMVDLQIKTVKDFLNSKDNNPKPEQVIWIPGDLKPNDQRQSLYLKRLKRDEAQSNTEIVETSFEVFKTVLNRKLDEISKPVEKADANKKTLYAIYEKTSAEKLQKYLDMIRLQGFKILEPDSQNGEFMSISEHIGYLLDSDAVLIYRGESNMEWLNSKIRDLVKIPGYGKEKPFSTVEIISPQKTADKALIFLRNVSVNWDEEINNEVINHFLDQLAKK